MSVPLWVRELAEAFWTEVGTAEPFPRGLRKPLLRTSFNLTVDELPSLSLARVERRLAALGCPRRCGQTDRPLRACLVADRGGGFIFLDLEDDLSERTFSLAHEVAHFLRDYWQPRALAVEALGSAILEVLDGDRAARANERLHALLRGQSVGCHIHFMRRRTDLLAEVEASEHDADRLALELLAPEEEVRARLSGSGGPAEAEALLGQAFGLPREVAASYAERLFAPPEPTTLMARLKKSLKARRTSSDSRESEEGGSRDEQPA